MRNFLLFVFDFGTGISQCWRYVVHKLELLLLWQIKLIWDNSNVFFISLSSTLCKFCQGLGWMVIPNTTVQAKSQHFCFWFHFYTGLWFIFLLLNLQYRIRLFEGIIISTLILTYCEMVNGDGAMGQCTKKSFSWIYIPETFLLKQKRR